MTKKILAFTLILSVAITGVVFGQELEGRLQAFVESVYENYADERFSEVYGLMHPQIQEVLTEDEYVDFQQHHFQRLKLTISEIEVGEVTKNPRLPVALRSLVSEANGEEFYGVALNYKAQFVSGVRFKQSISKTVYLAVVDSYTPEESIYLLWDPSSTQEEEHNDDGN